MHWNDHREDDPHREDQLPDEDDRDLIAGNLRRIKSLIYGTVDDSPASGRPGRGTSGRSRT